MSLAAVTSSTLDKMATTSQIIISDAFSMMTSSNWNIFRVIGPLCREFTSHWWISLTKASDAELWSFLWSAPEQTVGWTIEMLVIFTPSRSLWRHCKIVNEKFFILIKISLQFVPKGAIDDNNNLHNHWKISNDQYTITFDYIMAWCRIGDKPLSEPMPTQFIDRTRERWVKVQRPNGLCKRQHASAKNEIYVTAFATFVNLLCYCEL